MELSAEQGRAGGRLRSFAGEVGEAIKQDEEEAGAHAGAAAGTPTPRWWADE